MIKVILACLFMVGSIPALYVGGHIAVYFGFFPLFAVPAFLCVLIAGAFMHSYEKDIAWKS